MRSATFGSIWAHVETRRLCARQTPITRTLAFISGRRRRSRWTSRQSGAVDVEWTVYAGYATRCSVPSAVVWRPSATCGPNWVIGAGRTAFANASVITRRIAMTGRPGDCVPTLDRHHAFRRHRSSLGPPGTVDTVERLGRRPISPAPNADPHLESITTRTADHDDVRAPRAPRSNRWAPSPPGKPGRLSGSDRAAGRTRALILKTRTGPYGIETPASCCKRPRR